MIDIYVFWFQAGVGQPPTSNVPPAAGYNPPAPNHAPPFTMPSPPSANSYHPSGPVRNIKTL